MSFFEYIMVIGAILLGLGFAQLMIGASAIVRSRRWDLVHGTWVLALVVTHLQLWWAFWDLEALPTEAWNAGKFVYFVMGPAILFFCTNVLSPHPVPDDIDWRAHFERSRRPFLILVALLLAWTGGLAMVMSGQPFVHPARINQSLALGTALVGLSARSRRVHVVVAIVFLAILVANWFLVRWTPGAMTAG
ncbi:MAG: hypothetical protein OEU54_11450 [Gemmatimonadota bacterium]|nr:hypothetical protein [Gemmatimonadota bacterium]